VTARDAVAKARIAILAPSFFPFPDAARRFDAA
jgi:hypothetical protein